MKVPVKITILAFNEQGKVLLGLCKEAMSHEGKCPAWSAIETDVDSDMPIIKKATQAVESQTGIYPDRLNPWGIQDTLGQDKGCITLLYSVHEFRAEPSPCDPIVEWTWCSLEALPLDITPATIGAIKEWKAKTKYKNERDGILE